MDAALVVPAEQPEAVVREALVQGAGELLEDLRLFDVYTGSPVPEGQRSLAYAFTFRAPDRTLTGEEARAAFESAVAAAATATGAVLRG
jgi:phenylalanyl-tRNA synthetase beta chain